MLYALCAFAVAALPPMSSEDRAQEAELIAVGTVTRLESKEENVSGGTDHLFTVTLKVTKVEKALLADQPSPKTLTVRFRRTGKRPDGWTGPAGQHSVPTKGQTIRIYARNAPDGVWLLEPNGWEPVPAAASPALEQKKR